MPLHPRVASLLELVESVGAPPIETQDPATARAERAMLVTPSKIEVPLVRDLDAGGVPARLYRPVDDDRTTGLVVWYHGGGWVLGSVDGHDDLCRDLCVRSGHAVLSVEYRLAPEHPFPAGLDDAVASIRWAYEHARELGADPERLAVAGDSAGGNLAAVVASRLRDTAAAPRFQLLVYPVTDGTMGHPSYAENADGYFLTRDTMAWFWQHYVGSGSRTDPACSPLHAPASALEGVAPALVITAEFDPLRDEGEAYASRLSEAGVPCTTTRYDGVIHGFFQMGDMIPEGSQAIDEAAATLQRALA